MKKLMRSESQISPRYRQFDNSLDILYMPVAKSECGYRVRVYGDEHLARSSSDHSASFSQAPSFAQISESSNSVSSASDEPLGLNSDASIADDSYQRQIVN